MYFKGKDIKIIQRNKNLSIYSLLRKTLSPLMLPLALSLSVLMTMTCRSCLRNGKS